MRTFRHAVLLAATVLLLLNGASAVYSQPQYVETSDLIKLSFKQIAQSYPSFKDIPTRVYLAGGKLHVDMVMKAQTNIDNLNQYLAQLDSRADLLAFEAEPFMCTRQYRNTDQLEAQLQNDSNEELLNIVGDYLQASDKVFVSDVEQGIVPLHPIGVIVNVYMHADDRDQEDRIFFAMNQLLVRRLVSIKAVCDRR